VLEPHWMRAEGSARETLQGLIQAAVGYQHLANGNLEGARALLHDGAAKLLGRRLAGRDLDAFARAVAGHSRELAGDDAAAARRFDWTRVPPFPAEA
jgi:predicted metal-dependent hydrolase